MAKITVTMDKDTEVECFFKKKQVNLITSVNPAGSGTITPNGLNVYNKGTIVAVEGIPNADNEFDHFEVNGEEQPADPEG